MDSIPNNLPASTAVMERPHCPACNKTFPSETARDRHRLRCTQRPRRKKACAECRRSKTQCDTKVPACTRCTLLSLGCEYPQRLPTANAAAQCSWPSGSTAANHSEPLTVPTPRSLSSDGPPATDDSLSASNLTFDPFLGYWESGDASLWQTYPLDVRPGLYGFTQGGGYLDGAAPDKSFVSYNGPSTHEATETATEIATNPIGRFEINTSASSPWMTVEGGLQYIDEEFSKYPTSVIGVGRWPCFLHKRYQDESQMPRPLQAARRVAHVYSRRSSPGETAFLSFVDSELYTIQLKLSTFTTEEVNASLQAVFFYGTMRAYRCGSIAADKLGRLSETILLQTFPLTTHMCTDISERRSGSGDWENWILTETSRRYSTPAVSLDVERTQLTSFRLYFCFHALQYAIHSRSNELQILCRILDKMPLPSSTSVWEAETADAWAVAHQAWQQSDAGKLTWNDLIAFARGDVTGCDLAVTEWIRSTGVMGQLIMISAKEQSEVLGLAAVI
ncbi:hypothetical protein BX600DRAFT_451750 [Xylariales sp. PMI_506]|nr:hypothetical protein BX600DRAFT_451750 [Xylariales sp. PMI_506]